MTEQIKEKFPANYTALLTGPPGVGKYEYCLNLVRYYLEKGEGVVYITAEKSPLEIKERMKSTGFDLDQYETKKFAFIDIYSHSTGVKYDKGFHVDNPANLNLISIHMANAVQIVGKPVRIIFDSLSSLFLHASVPEIKKFFGVLSSRVKTEYGFILYTLQEEMHDEQTVTALKAMVDAVLEMKFEEGPPMKRRFRVHHAKGISVPTGWSTFEITSRGFEQVKEEILPAKEEPAAEVKEKFAFTKVKIGAALVLLLVIGAGFFYLKNTASPGNAGTLEEAKITDIYSLTTGKSVSVNGKTEPADIHIRNRKDAKASDKGWLLMETPFYRIEVNLDRSYYMLFDKLNDKDILVYTDRVENRLDMLTGSDIGYGEHKGNNLIPFSTTALHDQDGIPRYRILYEDKNDGFLLEDTEGWDVRFNDPTKGYDVEGEVLFGLFADKPYFINAVEFDNLQNLGFVSDIRSYKNPDEVQQTWVLTGEYDSAVIHGGDKDHLNGALYEQFSEVQYMFGEGRKSWHSGSAEFSKMFPEHRIIGNKLGGAVIFSLPEGRFRFDDGQGIFGDQVVGEFLLSVDKPVQEGEKPQKVVAFTTDAVNDKMFFYDLEDFMTVKRYKESIDEICKRYGLSCPGNAIDPHGWKTKRFVYVITLTNDWYDPKTNGARAETIELADGGLNKFKDYEDIIYKQLESTKPLGAVPLIR